MSEAGESVRMADRKESSGGGAAGAKERQSVGKMLTAAREAKTMSRQEASQQAKIPAHYVLMIETDDYSTISDQLYLLPFLRRYAICVGLDPEEVASVFVRDVQRADSTGGRMAEPIPIREPGDRSRLRRIAILMAVVILGLVLGYIAISLLASPRHAAAEIPEPPGSSAAAAPAGR